MAEEDDDKPTIVLDLDSLKKQLKQKENELSDIASDISFSAEKTRTSIKIAKTPIILFDFESTFFSENRDDLPEEDFVFNIIKTLPELNTILQKKEKTIVAFNYNASQKVATQLILQIKEKFPLVKVILLAKNLSKEKANQHKKTKAGAHAYLSIPISKDNFKEILIELNQQ